MAELLLKAGANANLITSNGNTIYQNISNNSSKIMKEFFMKYQEMDTGDA